MQKSSAVALILILGCAAFASPGYTTNLETVQSIQPHVIHLRLKAEDLKMIVEKQVVTRFLSSKNSKEVSGFGAALADATPAAFIESYRSMEALVKGPYAMEAGRFSPTPAISDLQRLTIDDKDLYALYKAKPGDADIKLSEREIARVRAVVGRGERYGPNMKTALANEYKKMLVERVSEYNKTGRSSLGVFADKGDPVDAAEAFGALADEQRETGSHCPHLYSHLVNYPDQAPPDSESFIYWSKQRFGDSKPVINIVHVLIHREGERVFIASKLIYASHYTEAGLSVAEFIPYVDSLGQPRTVIAYTLRLQLDLLGGTLGFMKKRMAQPRLLGTLKESINGLRLNMEALSRDSNPVRAGF